MKSSKKNMVIEINQNEFNPCFTIPLEVFY